MVMCRRLCRFDQVVSQTQYQQVSRFDSNVRSLASIGGDVTIKAGPIRARVFRKSKVHLEDAILAAQVFGILDDASCARPIANSRSWNLRVRGR
jgi:hypothetical protein